MSKFVLNIEKPQGVGGESTAQLVFLGDGGSPETFTVTINPAVDPAYPSLSSSIVAGTGKISVTGGSSSPGGLNTQVQFNNAGVFGGVSGATSDGTSVTFAAGKIQFNQAIDPANGFVWLYEDGNFNVGLGRTSVGFAIAGGQFNTGVGFNAGGSITTGSNNSSLGLDAHRNLTTGINNVAIGQGAMRAAVTTAASTAVGQGSLFVETGAGENTAIGAGAAASLTSGIQNTILGRSAGALLVIGSGNVFLGYKAGGAETGSNKLYIANSNTSTPLIGGDFSAGSLTFTVPGGVSDILSDAGTNTVVTVENIVHNSSGVIAAGFGAGIRIGLQDSTTANQDAALFDASWTTATHATRSSQAAIQAVDQATPLADVARFAFQHNAGSPVAQIIAVGTAAQAGIPQFTAAVDLTTGVRFTTGNVFFSLSGADKVQLTGAGLIADTIKLDFVNADVGLARVAANVARLSNGAAGFGWIQDAGESRVTAQFNVTNSAALANIPGLSINVIAGRTYSFQVELYTTSNVAGGVQAAIAGTATATAIIYEALTFNAAALAAQTRATALGTSVGGVTAVTVAKITITGTITVNAGGTLTVQFAQNASNGAASSVLVGSYFFAKDVP